MDEHRILFSPLLWRLVVEQAERQGISAAQFVREASLAWAILTMSRDNVDFGDEIATLLAQIRE